MPTPADLDRVLDVLDWGAALDRLQWAIVRDRAAGYSDAGIADRAHVPVAAMRRRYDAAIDRVVVVALGPS